MQLFLFIVYDKLLKDVKEDEEQKEVRPVPWGVLEKIPVSYLWLNFC